MVLPLDEARITYLARSFLRLIHGQDRDLDVESERSFLPDVEPMDWSDDDFINYGLSQLSAEERTAMANWLEAKLTSEAAAYNVLGHELRVEADPDHWSESGTGKDEPSKKGALAMGKYYVRLWRTGAIG